MLWYFTWNRFNNLFLILPINRNCSVDRFLPWPLNCNWFNDVLVVWSIKNGSHDRFLFWPSNWNWFNNLFVVWPIYTNGSGNRLLSWPSNCNCLDYLFLVLSNILERVHTIGSCCDLPIEIVSVNCLWSCLSIGMTRSIGFWLDLSFATLWPFI